MKLTALAYDKLSDDADGRLKADVKNVKLHELISHFAALIDGKKEVDTQLKSIKEDDDKFSWLLSLNAHDSFMANFSPGEGLDPFRLLLSSLEEKLKDSRKEVGEITGAWLSKSWHEATADETDLTKVMESFNETIGKIKIKKLNGALDKLAEVADRYQ